MGQNVGQMRIVMGVLACASCLAIGAFSVQNWGKAPKKTPNAALTSVEPRSNSGSTVATGSDTTGLVAVTIPDAPKAVVADTAPVGAEVTPQVQQAPVQPATGAVGFSQPQVLKVASAPAPAISNKADESPHGGMPPEVRSWLDHLYQIEMARRALATKGILNLIETYGVSLAGLAKEASDEDSDSEHSKAVDNLRNLSLLASKMQSEWIALERRLNSVPVPPECQTIDSYYTQSLVQTSQLIGEVGDICNRATGDPKQALGEAKNMVGQSSGKVDRPALRADSALATLFSRYHERKWFDLEGDVGTNLWGR